MSYIKVKNINIKKMTITGACNNIRPLIYETYNLDFKTTADFIKHLLINTLDGNYHLAINKNTLPILYAISVYNLKEEKATELYNKRWNNYDYKTKKYLYTKEEIEEATNELIDILYNIYLSYKEDNKKHVIKFHNSYITKVNDLSFNYSPYKERAKIFNSYTEAYIYIEQKFSNDYKQNLFIQAL